MALKKNQPIGIFDSGVGGLTVAHAITALLPSERIIYFGDTAHLPYGDKSPNSIRQYSEKISKFLLIKNCKAIVIACNTASSFAYEHLLQLFGQQVPVINVIEPVVEYVASCNGIKKIGVIGTKGTIRSEIYPKKIKEKIPSMSVQSLATPLLVPVIEEGFGHGEISKMVIREYLSNQSMEGIDSLILACTHYPIIKNEIEKFCGTGVRVIDSANIVARFVRDVLEHKKLLSDKPEGVHKFYVSDFTPVFEKTANLFFGEKISLEYYPIWNN